MVERPVGSSGFGRVSSSMNGRCRSSGRRPSAASAPPPLRSRRASAKSAAISSNDPYTSTRGYIGSSEVHTGIGEPQKRFREIDQSRALASHLPNCPSWMCPGTHSTCRFSSTIRSLIFVTATNHDDTARWISGESQRQQCGYEWSYVSRRIRIPAALRSPMIGVLASKTCIPSYGATRTVKRPCPSTGFTTSMPAASVTALSSSPNAGAMCTRPVPSSTVT